MAGAKPIVAAGAPKKRILLGLSGSVATVKHAELIMLLNSLYDVSKLTMLVLISCYFFVCLWCID